VKRNESPREKIDSGVLPLFKETLPGSKRSKAGRSISFSGARVEGKIQIIQKRIKSIVSS